MKTMLEAALTYAAHGWPVFPLAPREKKPLIAVKDGGRGYLDATTDAAQIRAWWTTRRDANIGLEPGAAGLLVVDVDGPIGEASAAALGIADIATLTCTTGRVEGGRHLYFTHPGGTIGNVDIGDHLDVRADLGYVAVSPSIHPSGARYSWGATRAIQSLPPSVITAITVAQARLEQDARHEATLPLTALTDAQLARRIDAYMAVLPSGLGDGDGRNCTAFRFAAWLVRDMARGEAEACSWLTRWNAGNADPLSQRELRATLRSALKHARRSKGSGLERATLPNDDAYVPIRARYAALSSGLARAAGGEWGA